MATYLTKYRVGEEVYYKAHMGYYGRGEVIPAKEDCKEALILGINITKNDYRYSILTYDSPGILGNIQEKDLITFPEDSKVKGE